MRFGTQKYTMQEIETCREELCARFPRAFMRHGDRHKKPLKKNIHKDIFSSWPECDHFLVRAVLYYYTIGKKYTSGVRIGAHRVDLDGNFAGAIIKNDVQYQEHSEYQRLQAMRAKGTASAKRITRPS